MPRQRAWRAWILLASYVFYAWWDWRFVLLLAGSTVVNHVLAVAIHRSQTGPARARACSRRRWRSTSACSATSSTRVSSSAPAENTLSRLGLADATWVLDVTLPVGISFYTFMAISYVVDTYRGELVPASFARFAVFQAFFPHLVAGPIVRGQRTAPSARAAARSPARRLGTSVPPHPQRPLPEGGDREPPGDCHRRRRLRRTGRSFVTRGAGRGLRLRRSRSSPTSAATRTSRSGSRCCWGSSSHRTSRRRTQPSRCRTSGAAGT